MNQPRYGHISVSGLDNIYRKKVRHIPRRQTGMIFQQYPLTGCQTALQNVLMGRKGYHSTSRSLFFLSKEEEILGLQSFGHVGLLVLLMGDSFLMGG